MQLYIS